MTTTARPNAAPGESRVITEIDGPVAYVSLNRPDKLNGVDLDTIDELIAAATALKENREIRAVVLQGRGRSFCAGLDFASAFTDKKRVARYFLAGPRLVNRFQRVNQVWRELPVPVIAVVQGHCYGAGLQLAACADFRFTTPDATWSILEAKWGLVPDMAGTVPFSELLPADVLMRLAMTGEQLTGERAVELGLATGVADDPLAAALALVEQIAQRSPDSVAATKRLVYGTRRGSLRATYRLERRLQSAMFKARNTAIARKAGAAKEAPVFGPRTFG
ncbi:crotonase/enoyl-CoA hydratase family protein [Aeromicrobium sp. S22]|uniref:crotonase/enoyl-CoA hydratase family protein n=1 Tax=Aeromicrobium sp. S22 TaxID=2662029 RepID=UPI00129D71B2|nr:crotonase/enoyl-CoA hydratase family protein [Aeromicrobium sp. S22]MRJ99952.1 crotonase/enoyl-CoA hydratase family protein [Aeromicrobium sp. S22]